MSVELFLALVGIVVIAIIILVVISKTGHSSKHDVEGNRQQMAEYEKLATSTRESDRHMAVVRADSLLGKALETHGLAGATMGERMKKASFSNADSVWAAHKLRNRIAHESNVMVTTDGARRAMAGFKQAMKDLGAL